MPPTPAAPALLANPLAELSGQRSHATVSGRLAAIAQAHALLRLPFDASDPELRKTLQDVTRTHGRRPQRRAAPLLTADVIRIASACGGSLRGERDRALLLLGFAGAFRRSELVRIRVADLSFGPQRAPAALQIRPGRQRHDRSCRGQPARFALPRGRPSRLARGCLNQRRLRNAADREGLSLAVAL